LTLETGLSIAAVALVVAAVPTFALIAKKTSLNYEETTLAMVGVAALAFAGYSFYAEYERSGEISPLALGIVIVVAVAATLSVPKARKRRRG
jgi:hypothetical protein